jgi:hypothetical protein
LCGRVDLVAQLEELVQVGHPVTTPAIGRHDREERPIVLDRIGRRDSPTA